LSKTIVLAFGGNAIIKPGQEGTWTQQLENVDKTCAAVADLLKQGNRVVISHGNGPQVGNILLKNEFSKEALPPMPIDVIVSNTQGAIGYAIVQQMRNYFSRVDLDIPIVALITQTVVDADDTSFQKPTKFIGPFFSEEEARELMNSKGYVMRQDSVRGWRRVVPSPEPLEIVENDVIRKLVNQGVLVVAVGGGGIPVIRTSAGIRGIEAVIDKDKASALLAEDIGADMLYLLTEVDRVCINFGTPNQRELPSMSVAEARKYLREGQFPPGSMGPKIEAAVRFAVSGPGRESAIVSLENAGKVMNGDAGTIIHVG